MSMSLVNGVAMGYNPHSKASDKMRNDAVRFKKLVDAMLPKFKDPNYNEYEAATMVTNLYLRAPDYDLDRSWFVITNEGIFVRESHMYDLFDFLTGNRDLIKGGNGGKRLYLAKDSEGFKDRDYIITTMRAKMRMNDRYTDLPDFTLHRMLATEFEEGTRAERLKNLTKFLSEYDLIKKQSEYDAGNTPGRLLINSAKVSTKDFEHELLSDLNMKDIKNFDTIGLVRHLYHDTGLKSEYFVKTQNGETVALCVRRSYLNEVIKFCMEHKDIVERFIQKNTKKIHPRGSDAQVAIRIEKKALYSLEQDGYVLKNTKTAKAAIKHSIQSTRSLGFDARVQELETYLIRNDLAVIKKKSNEN